MITLQPIGWISSPHTDKYAAPSQPNSGVASDHVGTITLEEGHNYHQALQDLDGFELIWVVFGFDRNESWKPLVLPPRSPTERRGVFATRSPHRPNAIGISACRLLRVDGLHIQIADPDILDKSPIYDIKPYIPYADAYPDARAGWLDDVSDQSVLYNVTFTQAAAERVDDLEARFGIALRSHIERVLLTHPFEHSYRRISAQTDGSFVLAVRSWRVRYTLDRTSVLVSEIFSGYPRDAVRAATMDGTRLHDHDAHVDFHQLGEAVDASRT